MAAGKLSAAIAREIGIDTEPRANPLLTSVGVAVVKIVPNNPNRFALLIMNLGSVAMYVKPSLDVSATSGIRLAPNGGQISLNWREDFHLTGWDWYAIADAAATELFVLEVVGR